MRGGNTGKVGMKKKWWALSQSHLIPRKESTEGKRSEISVEEKKTLYKDTVVHTIIMD